MDFFLEEGEQPCAQRHNYLDDYNNDRRIYSNDPRRYRQERHGDIVTNETLILGIKRVDGTRTTDMADYLNQTQPAPLLT